MITRTELDKLRSDLSIKSKNGIDFIIASCITWLLISLLWVNYSDSPNYTYIKSVQTFVVGALMLPLALLLSKLLKTSWKNNENPLQPFGLWLNISQLLYFPFLFFALFKYPGYFVMMYVIITGAHLFPYAWFYKTNIYAVFAVIIGFGSLVLGLMLPPENTYLIPLFMSLCAAVLAVLLYSDYLKKRRIVN